MRHYWRSSLSWRPWIIWAQDGFGFLPWGRELVRLFVCLFYSVALSFYLGGGWGLGGVGASDSILPSVASTFISYRTRLWEKFVPFLQRQVLSSCETCSSERYFLQSPPLSSVLIMSVRRFVEKEPASGCELFLCLWLLGFLYFHVSLHSDINNELNITEFFLSTWVIVSFFFILCHM